MGPGLSLRENRQDSGEGAPRGVAPATPPPDMAPHPQTPAPRSLPMRVGVPREIKPDEYRIGLTPTAVREYVTHGHEVFVESGAGEGAGYADGLYGRAGAKIVPDAEAV